MGIFIVKRGVFIGIWGLFIEKWGISVYFTRKWENFGGFQIKCGSCGLFLY
jgi:hypothetical protein